MKHGTVNRFTSCMIFIILKLQMCNLNLQERDGNLNFLHFLNMQAFEIFLESHYLSCN